MHINLHIRKLEILLCFFSDPCILIYKCKILNHVSLFSSFSVDMPSFQIEAHASACEGPLSTQAVTGSHGRAPCPVCGDVFPVQVLPQHAAYCLEPM